MNVEYATVMVSNIHTAIVTTKSKIAKAYVVEWTDKKMNVEFAMDPVLLLQNVIVKAENSIVVVFVVVTLVQMSVVYVTDLVCLLMLVIVMETKKIVTVSVEVLE